MTAELRCVHCKKSYHLPDPDRPGRATGICPDCLLKHYGLTPEHLNALTRPVLPPVKHRTYSQLSLPFRPTKWT